MSDMWAYTLRSKRAVTNVKLRLNSTLSATNQSIQPERNLSAAKTRPQWQQRSLSLSKEERGYQFNKRFNKLQDLNSSYFQHISGQCKCGKCSCSRCRCVTQGLQISSQMDPPSRYMYDFKNNTIEKDEPFTLDKNPYKDSFAKMELKTTQRIDYSPKKSTPEIQLDRTSIICGKQQLDSSTVYNQTFKPKIAPQNVLFTHEAIENFRVPHSIKQHISSESACQYGQNLPSSKIESINFALDRSRNLKPPISMDGRMDLNTTQRVKFNKTDTSATRENNKSFSEVENPFSRQFIKQKNNWVSHFTDIPSTKDQFLSNFKKDYANKKSENCEGWKIGGDLIEERASKQEYQPANVRSFVRF